MPDEDQHYDLAAVNALGYAYATAPDSPAKEAKLLEVMECFHGYLMKYLCMIVRGTIPPANSRAGRDAKELLRTLAPRGVKFTKPVVDATCKTLHLAFKQQTTEDIQCIHMDPLTEGGDRPPLHTLVPVEPGGLPALCQSQIVIEHRMLWHPYDHGLQP